MTALRVSLDPRDAAVQRPVLAGLPGRFVVADGGPAEVAVVSGEMMNSGSRGISCEA